MKRYRVTLTPAAFADLEAIETYIAGEAEPDIATRFVEDIADHCFGLDYFPHRGTPRDDLRSGIRSLVFRRSVTIVYAVEGGEVAILGIFYAGRDVKALFTERGS